MHGEINFCQEMKVKFREKYIIDGLDPICIILDKIRSTNSLDAEHAARVMDKNV